jgi:hypothetical protein
VVPYILEERILLIFSKIKGTMSSAKMGYIAVVCRHGSFDMSGTALPVTHCHIPEVQNLQIIGQF